MGDEPGLIQVYTGDGKGKTTAALGLAMRAAGCGLRVLMIQFLKSSQRYGELAAAARLAPQFEIIQKGSPCMRDDLPDGECDGCLRCHIDPAAPKPADLDAARDAMQCAREAMASGRYDMLILDEINYALSYRLIELDDLLALLDDKPAALELVLTGRDAHPRIIERADLVTEMTQIKHPFDQGVQARKGIEY